MQTLDSNDYRIFIELQDNPYISLAAMSKRIPLSTEGIRQRLLAMKHRGFLRPDREITDPIFRKRMQSELEATYNPHALGLLRQHVIFRGINTTTQLHTLMKFCDDHPYTHYYVSMVQNNNNLYAQFDVPFGARHTMLEVYTALQKRELFTDYTVTNAETVTTTPSDFSRWNTHGYWNTIATEQNENVFQNYWDSYFQKHTDIPPISTTQPQLAAKFDAFDAKLLRELTINAKISNKTLSTYYGKDHGTISRRVKRIRQNFLLTDQLYFDRSVFGISGDLMVYGEFGGKNRFSKELLYAFQKSNTLPFYNHTVINNNSYLIYISFPASYAAAYAQFLWEHSKYIDVYVPHLSRAKTYYFYHENWEGNKWKVDTDYIKNVPLSNL